MKTKIMEAGSRFGRLTVIEQSPNWKIYTNKKGVACRVALWIVECTCGARLTVQGTSLRSGNTTSCKSCRRSETHKTQYKTLFEQGKIQRDDRGCIVAYGA